MVAGFQPGENQNPLPRAAGRFDHHPPLPGRHQRRLLQEDPQPRVWEPPPGMPPLRPLCPQGPAQRRHIRPGAKWIPGGLNPDEPQLLGRTRKKKSRCGTSTNPRGVIQCFSVGSVFSLLRAGFSPQLSATIVSTPYIYRDELPISITHFGLYTSYSSSFMVVSSLSSP